MNLRIVDRLAEEELQVLLGGREDPFSMKQYGLTWRPKQQHLLRYADGHLVAKASLLKHELLVDKRSIQVGGVGGVITSPEARNRGHATAIMEQTAIFLRDQLRVPFGLLFCRPPLVDFYTRLGWRVVYDEVLVQQPGAELLSPMPVMTFACTADPWPAGTVRLLSQPW